MPDDDEPIYPTHTCFDDALELMAMLNSPELQPKLTVVHALCQAPDGGVYAHAWLERDGIGAIFGGIFKGEKVYVEAPLEEYRAGLKIQDETRYTVSEAIRENRRTNHLGPWVERYRQACADVDRRGPRVFDEPEA